VPPELEAAISIIDRGPSCDAAVPENVWLSSLHTVAQWSLSYLDAAEATSLMETAVPTECLANASPRARAWVRLYQAIAARNAEGMASSGTAALADADVDAARSYYALAAAMLGNLASDRPDRTLQLWRERPASLQNESATPDVDLITRTAEKRLADGIVLSQGSP
jgi:hypothetical protein